MKKVILLVCMVMGSINAGHTECFLSKVKDTQHKERSVKDEKEKEREEIKNKLVNAMHRCFFYNEKGFMGAFGLTGCLIGANENDCALVEQYGKELREGYHCNLKAAK